MDLKHAGKESFFKIKWGNSVVAQWLTLGVFTGLGSGSAQPEKKKKSKAIWCNWFGNLIV